MGPFAALEVRGPVVRLDLPPELGKISSWVHVRRLKFFEQRDADFSDFDAPAVPVVGGQGALRYETHRVGGHRPPNALPAKEYLVQWKGYDTSQMTWVPRATLLTARILAAYEAAPTTAQARPSAPKRAPQSVAPPRVQRRSPRLAATSLLCRFKRSCRMVHLCNLSTWWRGKSVVSTMWMAGKSSQEAFPYSSSYNFV